MEGRCPLKPSISTMLMSGSSDLPLLQGPITLLAAMWSCLASKPSAGWDLRILQGGGTSGCFVECGIDISRGCWGFQRFFKMATHLLLLSSLFQPAACCTLRLVAENAEAQLPLWFVSHAWLEPIKLFLACLRCHAVIRDLQVNGAKPPAYWVCAYANNQHILGEAISDNPRKTSFFKAMQLCQGVLLVLDMLCTPFTRIWCCFEESIAAEHLVSDRF